MVRLNCMKLFLLLYAASWLYMPGVIAQKKKIIPPGTVKINDTLFADQTEVANIHWREYLYSLSQYDSAALPGALPDTSVWLNDDRYYGEPYTDFYFRHPMYNNYPVVGITNAQALAFCQWRTWATNFTVYIREKQIEDWRGHINDTFPLKFYYRLPTVEEWEMLANPPIDSTSKAFNKWKGKATFFFNTKERNTWINNDSAGTRHYSGYSITAPLNSFFPGKYKTFNLTGNVAEMTSVLGIAKGGSFKHTLAESFYKNTQSYTKPEHWLGFRCVAVLIK